MSTATVRLLIALALLSPPADAGAQTSPPNAGDLVNHTTPVAPGFASNGAADQKTLALVLRPSIPLRRYEPDRLGIRLRLGLGLAIVEFDRTILPDLDDVRAAAFIPGVEVLIPLGWHSALRPWLDLGVGVASDGNDPFWLSTLGLRYEVVSPWKRWELGVEPGVEYRISRSPEGRNDDETARIGTYIDARHPLWFRMGDSQPTAGLYGYGGVFLVPLEFTLQNGVQEDITTQFELGAVFGFERRPKVWFFRVPTVRIGYAFGGLSGLRLRIGADRVVSIYYPEPEKSEIEADAGP